MTGKKAVIPGLLLLLTACFQAAAPWAPPVEGSRIVIYRPGSVVGFAKQHLLSVNQRPVAILANGRYVVLDVSPGQYAVKLDDEPLSVMTAQPGQASYLRVNMQKNAEKLTVHAMTTAYEEAAKRLQDMKAAEVYVPPDEEEDARLSQDAGPRT